MMSITDAELRALSAKCAPYKGPWPPLVLTRTVAALFGSDEVTSAYTTYDRGSLYTDRARSRWELWATTDQSLVHVDIEVHTVGYDLEEEQAGRWRNDAPEMTTHDAWVRPLRSITGLALPTPAFGSISRNGKSQLFVESVKVSFADPTQDDETISFNFGRSSPEPAAQLAGEFVGELRRGLFTP